MPTGGEVGPEARGFSLGESELGISASIDPTFSGRLTAAFAPDNSVGVEEAWFQGAGLFEGGNLRAGRFLSGIGYLNERHAHTWDFIDAPLVHQAFFGGQIKTDGLQVRWVAPTDRFVEIGAEVGSGTAFPGSGSGRNGIGSATLFAHLGDDIGANASWRVGVSLLANKADDRAYDDLNGAGIPVTNSFTGRTRTWGLDGIYKWAPGGNASRRNLTCKASSSSGAKAARWLTTPSAQPARHRQAITAWCRTAGTCRRSTSSCRGGVSARATTASTPARRASARSRAAR